MCAVVANRSHDGDWVRVSVPADASHELQKVDEQVGEIQVETECHEGACVFCAACPVIVESADPLHVVCCECGEHEDAYRGGDTYKHGDMDEQEDYLDDDDDDECDGEDGSEFAQVLPHAPSGYAEYEEQECRAEEGSGDQRRAESLYESTEEDSHEQ